MTTPPATLEQPSSFAQEQRSDEEAMEDNHEQEDTTTTNSKEECIEIFCRAQRRKQKASSATLGVTPNHSLAAPSTTTSKPKPTTLPKDNYKLVIRPKEGLSLTKLNLAKLAGAILHESRLTWREADIRIRVEETQNIITVNTPHQKAARALNQIREISIDRKTHPVNIYGLAPADSVKGVIHDVTLHYNMQQVLDDLYSPGQELLTCRRLGNTGTVVITFQGHKVPFYVYYMGVEVKCYLYRKTVPVCSVCHVLGHRADVCPNPTVRSCDFCGARDPTPEHVCKPQCALCNGDHLTASKGCPKRFCEPFVLRQKALARDRETRRVSAQSRPSRSRSRGRSSSRHASRKPSRSRSRSKKRSTSHAGQVSWASIASPAAHTPTLTQHQCAECTKVKAENERLEAKCAKVQAELRSLREEFAALKEAITTQTNEKRRKMVVKKDLPVEPEQPRVEPREENTQIVEIITQTIEAQLKQSTARITEQLGTLTARVYSMYKESGALHKRIEVLEKSPSRRREKPYDRPNTQDPQEGFSGSSNGS